MAAPNLDTQSPQHDLQATFNGYKKALAGMAQRIGEVEQEIEEHCLVIETLEDLPEDRKCFRLINGVLVERTIQNVMPALKQNSTGLQSVLTDLQSQYDSKSLEFEKWKVSGA